MALSDFNVSTFSPKHVEANRMEALVAHDRNGTLKQRDWWRISKNAVASGFEIVHDSNTVQFLIETDLDTRHVAILCAPEAHLDPYEISQIFRAAPVDGSTVLAAYVYAVTDILEGYYAEACKIFNYHPFIKDGKADWTTLSMGRDDNDYMPMLAELWQNSEQQFLFDAGRKQILYAALEADLEAHDIKPDWFIPSHQFLPHDGREAETQLITWDLAVHKIPDSGFDWYLGPPERPSQKGPGLATWLKEKFR